MPRPSARLGSTTDLTTDGVGRITGTYAYDALGSVRAHSGAETE